MAYRENLDTPSESVTLPDDSDVESLVGQMIDDAVSYVESDIRPARNLATDYYKARPFGNEEVGRSQIVLPELRNAVRSIMPSLMRIFTGPERYVEYIARRYELEEQASQATDYINFIVMEDNPGYQVKFAAFKDALVRRTGVIKWGAEEIEEEEAAEYTGLTEQQMLSFLLDKDVELTEVQQESAPDESGQPTFSATVARKGPRKHIFIVAVPGEEVSWNRNARDFESASIVVHTRFPAMSELVAMGYDKAVLEDHVGKGSAVDIGQQTEEDARRNDGGALKMDDIQDDATRPVRYDEAYVRLAYDPKKKELSDDARVRLYKVCMVGDAHKLIADPEPVSHRPFTLLTPDPEPHTVDGGISVADDVMPLMKAKSSVVRGIFDSLALAIDPATEIVDGAVNMKDLLNPEIGRLVRTTAPGMMREVKHTFIGGDALPVLDMLDQFKEDATGTSRAAAGLDADAMQSTTKQAVASTISKAQEQVELISRHFAEALRIMYKGLLRTVIENQDGPRIVRLRGKYVEIDPKAWDATMDVRVNVALGQGTAEEKIQTLIEIKTVQETIMTTLGPTNMLVGLSEYRHTLAKLCELRGYHPDAFFKAVDPQKEAQAEEAAAQASAQQPHDPNAALAQAEIQKAQIMAQVKREEMQMKQQSEAADLQLRQGEAQHKAALEEHKVAIDSSLKAQEMEMKYKSAIDRDRLKTDAAAHKAGLDADVKLQVAHLNAAVHHEKTVASDIASQRAAAVKVHGTVHSTSTSVHDTLHRTATTLATAQLSAETAKTTAKAKAKEKPKSA